MKQIDLSQTLWTVFLWEEYWESERLLWAGWESTCRLISYFMAVSLLFGGGGAPQAAIALGAGDRKKAEKYLGCCLLPLIVCGVVFSFSLLVWGEQILPLFGATDANLPYAYQYIRIICLGIPFSMLITGMNIFINTQGKTMMGMISVIIGAVINQL